MNKRILVLGGTQFVGRNLVEGLLANTKHDITLLNRGSKQPFGNKVETLIADRKDRAGCQKVLSGKEFDIIYDVSGYTADDSRFIVEAVNGFTGVYIYISTAAVYLSQSNLPIREDSEVGSHKIWGEYGRNKVEAENYLLKESDTQGFELVVIRPSYLYGKYNHIPRERFVFERLMNNLPIFLPGGGSAVTQFGHIFDLSKLLVSLAGKQNIRGVFNVSTKELTSLRGFVEAASRACKKKPIIIDVDLTDFVGISDRDVFPFDNVTYYTDISKAQDVLGYAPEISILDGLKMEFSRADFDSKPILLPKEQELKHFCGNKY